CSVALQVRVRYYCMTLYVSLVVTIFLAPLNSHFIILIPPPMISPLFPYTTLFRSHSYSSDSRTRLIRRYNSNGLYRCFLIIHYEDRKSTRLNSSHVSISYAVFCLKKKKEKYDD